MPSSAANPYAPRHMRAVPTEPDTPEEASAPTSARASDVENAAAEVPAAKASTAKTSTAEASAVNEPTAADSPAVKPVTTHSPATTPDSIDEVASEGPVTGVTQATDKPTTEKAIPEVALDTKGAASKANPAEVVKAVEPASAQPNIANNVFDVALVFEGGGTRASYTAGIANVLLDQGIYFNYVCGISAGSSHTLDYCSRDRDRTRRSFVDYAELTDHTGLGSMLRGTRYFDADYLYEGCTLDGYMPFDWGTFAANPADVGMSSLDSVTGETIVFTKSQMHTLHETINYCRMSSSLPGFMHPITYHGHRMYDGGLGQGAGIPTFMAERAGYTKFVLVRTRARSYRKTRITENERRMLSALGKRNPVVAEALLSRNERYNAEVERMEQLEREGRLLMICPESMYIKSTTLDVEKLRGSYLLGYEQGVRELPRIREFVFGSADGGPHAQPAEWLAKIESDRRALMQPLDVPTIDPETQGSRA